MAPLNVGDNTQYKSGALVVNASTTGPNKSFGLQVWEPTFLMGTTTIGSMVASSDLMLDVNGKIGAMKYCDENGANCILASALGGSSGGGSSGVYGGAFGDFSDGSYILNASQAAVSGLFSVNGTTFTLLRNGNFDVLEVAAGYSLDTNNYMVHANRVTGAGKIHNNGADGGNAIGSTSIGIGAPAKVAGTLSTNTAGRNGGADDGGAGVIGISKSPSLGVNGVTGGSGGYGYGSGTGGGAGGTAGVATAETVRLGQTIPTVLVANTEGIGKLFFSAIGSVSGTLLSTSAGSGGGGGGAHWNSGGNGGNGKGGSGGGSGAGGGVLAIYAQKIDGTLSIEAKGGKGGNGGAGDCDEYVGGGGGGAGGSGGVAFLVYETLGGSVTVSVAGGDIGSGGGYGCQGLFSESGFPYHGATGSNGPAGNTGVVYKLKLSPI
jgi:hypothetical protein